MFERLKNLFPYKAKSAEDFVEFVKSEGCPTVTAMSYLVTVGASESAAVGLIATFQYYMELNSTTPRGRKVIWREFLFDRFGSDRGLSDSAARQAAAIKGLMLTEERVKVLRVQLPGISIEQIGPKGPMDEATFERLHRDAKTCGVTITG